MLNYYQERKHQGKKNVYCFHPMIIGLNIDKAELVVDLDWEKS